MIQTIINELRIEIQPENTIGHSRIPEPQAAGPAEVRVTVQLTTRAARCLSHTMFGTSTQGMWWVDLGV
jgi:hypothetical protein